jgi:flavodoxin
MSNVQLQENIETYLYAVNEIRNSITVIQGERYIENHKKTLLFSVIDLLAKGVYGNKFGNKRTDMFEKFILEFCEWENAEKISLQQLVHLLDKTEEDTFSRLKDFAKTELHKYPDCKPVPLDRLQLTGQKY